MKNYIVYDRETGEILRTGSCPDSMIEMQAASENELAIEGAANDDKHYIKDGKVAELPVKVKEERKRLIKSKPIGEVNLEEIQEVLSC